MHTAHGGTALSTHGELPRTGKTTARTTAVPKRGPRALGVLTTSSFGPAVETICTLTPRRHLSVHCADVGESRGGWTAGTWTSAEPARLRVAAALPTTTRSVTKASPTRERPCAVQSRAAFKLNPQHMPFRHDEAGLQRNL